MGAAKTDRIINNGRWHMKKIAIAGAGTMGRSMAQIFASNGFDAVLYNRRQPSLDKARDFIRQSLETMAEAGELKESIAEITSRITFTTDKDCFAGRDFIIENIAEDLEIKKAFFAEISEIADPQAVIATNTSGLSINAMAEVTKLPERFIGMHWFNPPHMVLLVEIIRGDATNDTSAQAIHDLCVSIGRKPVIVNKDLPGFAANRIQIAMLREALDLVQRGVVTPEGIDDIMKYGLGFRLACAGPLQIADLGGLDVWYHVCDYLCKDICSSREAPSLLREHAEKGELGVKTGRGFYDYSGDKAAVAIKERDRKMIAVFEALYKEK